MSLYCSYTFGKGKNIFSSVITAEKSSILLSILVSIPVAGFSGQKAVFQKAALKPSLRRTMHISETACPAKQFGHKDSPSSNWHPDRIWSYAIKSLKMKLLYWLSRTGSLDPAVNLVHFCFVQLVAVCSIIIFHLHQTLQGTGSSLFVFLWLRCC